MQIFATNFKTLVRLLLNVRGNTFVGADVVTTVKLTGGKSNPMQGRVTKHSVIGGQLFTHEKQQAYELMVNRRREAEGKAADFQVANRRWGQRMQANGKSTPIIQHKDAMYLEVIIDPAKCNKTWYELDGQQISKDDIQGLPAPRSGSGRQGVKDENAVIVRTYKFDSLRRVRLMQDEVQVGDWTPVAAS
jgi:hypothetical protein